MRLSCALAVDLQSFATATSHCPSTQKRAAVGFEPADGITMGLELLLADPQPAAAQTNSFVAD